MSAPLPEHTRDEPLERALAALETPRARPQFRAALRERFLAGAQQVVGGGQDGGASDRAPRGRGRLYMLGLGLAAAAAVIVFFVLSRPRESVWRVLDGTGASGAVLVDGQRIDVGDRAALAGALLSARELETLAVPLRAEVRGEVVLDLAPGTRLTQMRFAAAGGYSLRTEQGSLSVATRPAFGGRGLRVFSPDLELGVTGTRFAVDVEARGTCVCCFEGRLGVTPRGEPEARAVEAGRMCYAHRDGSPPLWGDVVEAHVR